MSSSTTKVSPAGAVPKYKHIADDIRRQMQEGLLRPGDRLPSLAEMRAMYGVTPTTVERIYAVLREDGLIVREQGRGTFVAEPVTRPVTGVIGLTGITFDLQQSPYWADLMAGIQTESEKLGYELLLLNEASVIRWERVDGVLLCGPLGVKSHNRLPLGMPSVVALAQMSGATCVDADDAQGVRQAIHHLLELGHTRIGYLVSERSQHRLDYYRRWMREAGIDVNEKWIRLISREDNAQRAYDMMREWLDETDGELGVTALLAQNDEAAISAIEAMRKSGIRTPEDISVVGFDGTVISDYFSPRLTSVLLPLQTIGAIAVQELVNTLNGEKSLPMTKMLPVSLKPGHSTAALIQ